MNAPPTSHRAPAEPTTPRGRRPDESMTLLTEMMERPLDPSYAAAARRRREAGLPAATSTRTVTMLIATIVVGLLLTMGALSLRRTETVASRARSDLVAQIEARRADADARARQVQALQTEIDRAQASALGGDQGALASRLGTLGRATGSEAVSGPGITVTVDDARADGVGGGGGDPRSQSGSDDGRVLSKDLQIIVNGLWQAGAEAIAINGQRLTSRSAIRFAGDAILVNYRPLTRPYTIEAIGNPGNLEVEFADTAGGSYLRALQDNYGVRASIAPAERLTLPAATSLTLRTAAPPTPASTPPPSPTGGRSTPDQNTTPDQSSTTTEPAQ